ncbi:ATP-binding protein [Streptomyces sp. NPDC048639]|uniref:ATP-binding protein n=1 Tax=Streptomyces sp. NPDC048639 TaxID=3365581 RepID=UPI0037138293
MTSPTQGHGHVQAEVPGQYQPGAQSQTQAYEPHPFIGGRNAALRALTAWRAGAPEAPRVVALTGSPGTGCSRLLTGFLMLCDPEYRKQLPLDALDPATVPPELPAPAVPGPDGLTAAQLLWVLADHYDLAATRAADVYAELGARTGPVTVVVPDVDRAGPVRAASEPARLVREVLKPLAAVETVRLLVDVPRTLATELVEGLPPGTALIIDLDDPQWADPEGLVLQADAMLRPEFGAPELPFTTDDAARRALATAIARRAGDGAGSRLTVQLAVQSILTQPDGFDPANESQLPRSIGEALNLHAVRLGAEPLSLRRILAPLALAEGDGLPPALLAPLASAAAGEDMSEAVAGGMLLAAPFIQALGIEDESVPEPDRTLIRLQHPGIAATIRAGLPDIPGAQARIAMHLLEGVPEQNWAKAAPYVRDHIAAHTLEAGILPQLLTDPGLFVHSDPVHLRAAVEAVPVESLDSPARTYLRTAPLLTRTEAPAVLRAALLETAFVEDGLSDYADAVRRTVAGLPWHTLWSAPVEGVSAVSVGRLPRTAAAQSPGENPESASDREPESASSEQEALPVVALVVPVGTPGARPVDDADGPAVLLYGLTEPGHADGDPAQVLRPSEDERAAAPLAFSRGADYVRVWDRADEDVVAALISDTPVTAADLSPDGVLVVATERGVKALRILSHTPAIAS